MTIVWRLTFRHAIRHPLQMILSIVGVAIGVAVVVSISLVNQSAKQGFRSAVEALSGKATHEIVAGPEGISDTVYRHLRMNGIRNSTPVVEGFVSIPGRPGYLLKVIGVDPLADVDFRDTIHSVADPRAITTLMTEPWTIAVPVQVSRNLGIVAGSSLGVSVGGRRRTLHVVSLLHLDDQRAAVMDNVIVADIATAQELLGMEGRLSRIDMVFPEERKGEFATRISRLLPEGASVSRSDARSDAMEEMTRAFSINLTALSLLALVVGAFLVYNTMTFSVLQRRRQFGILRALGTTRKEIVRLVMSEAALIGAAGTTLGFGLGIFLGNGLLRLVSRTINDLYFSVTIPGLSVTPVSVMEACFLGVAVTLIAAAIPAREAVSVPPQAALSRSFLESRSKRAVPVAAFIGVLSAMAGAGLLFVPTQNLSIGFVALFTMITGYALIIPWLVLAVVPFLTRLAKLLFGIMGALAVRGIGASLSRTGTATAALVIALSATIGVGVMVESFRTTVVEWLSNYLKADIYLTSEGPDRGPGKPPLNPAFVESIPHMPGVSSTAPARRAFLQLDGRPIEIFAVQVTRESFSGYRFAEEEADQAWQTLNQGGVLVSEPFAHHHKLHAGDSIQLPTPNGVRILPVAGVYFDYSSDQGKVTMALATYQRLWNDMTVDSVGINVAEGFDVKQLAAKLREASPEGIVVYTNRSLRERSLATFDRTFVITGVLRLLAIIVAFVGIVNALLAISMERAREVAVMRALGVTPRQVYLITIAETGTIGLLSAVFAVPLGILQALVLIFVVNKRSFGWTLHMHVEPAILIQALLLAMIAALLAALYPAYRMASISPALALRED